MKLYGVTGWKNSGKTGLMERLVREMGQRGLSVSISLHQASGLRPERNWNGAPRNG